MDANVLIEAMDRLFRDTMIYGDDDQPVDARYLSDFRTLVMSLPYLEIALKYTLWSQHNGTCLGIDESEADRQASELYHARFNDTPEISERLSGLRRTGGSPVRAYTSMSHLYSSEPPGSVRRGEPGAPSP